MFGLLAGGLSALGGLTDSFSGLLGPLLGYSSARDANSNMRKMAAENRDWLNRMSNTAHQREVRDLRAAGLNPILSAGGLSGASTPSVSTDYAQQSYTPDFSGVGKGLKNAASAVSFYQGLKNQSANTHLQESQAAQANSATELNNATTEGKRIENGMKLIDAKYHEDKVSAQTDREEYEADRAYSEALKSLIDTSFLLSPRGQFIYSAQQAAKAFPGQVFDSYSFGLGGRGLKGNGSYSSSRPAWMNYLDEDVSSHYKRNFGVLPRRPRYYLKLKN